MLKYIYRIVYLLATTLVIVSCSKKETPHQKKARQEKEIANLFTEWEQKRQPILEELDRLYEKVKKFAPSIEDLYDPSDIPANKPEDELKDHSAPTFQNQFLDKVEPYKGIENFTNMERYFKDIKLYRESVLARLKNREIPRVEKHLKELQDELKDILQGGWAKTWLNDPQDTRNEIAFFQKWLEYLTLQKDYYERIIHAMES